MILIYKSGLLFLGNLAYRKPTTQGPGTNAYHYASRAVDGNLDPGINHGSCAHPYDPNDADGSAWWKVDLQEIYVIISVNITNRIGQEGRLMATSWNGI